MASACQVVGQRPIMRIGFFAIIAYGYEARTALIINKLASNATTYAVLRTGEARGLRNAAHPWRRCGLNAPRHRCGAARHSCARKVPTVALCRLCQSERSSNASSSSSSSSSSFDMAGAAARQPCAAALGAGAKALASRMAALSHKMRCHSGRSLPIQTVATRQAVPVVALAVALAPAMWAAMAWRGKMCTRSCSGPTRPPYCRLPCSRGGAQRAGAGAGGGAGRGGRGRGRVGAHRARPCRRRRRSGCRYRRHRCGAEAPADTGGAAASARTHRPCREGGEEEERIGGAPRARQ